jgi:hypothetical protein
LKSGRGDWIRTSAPLRPRARSHDFLRRYANVDWSQVSDPKPLDAGNCMTSRPFIARRNPAGTPNKDHFCAGCETMPPCFKARIDVVGPAPGPRRGWMRFFLARGSRRSTTSPSGPQIVKTCAISGMKRQYGRDLSSVSRCRRLDLLVAPAGANRKQAHSNPSGLERYDAAVLQGVGELG